MGKKSEARLKRQAEERALQEAKSARLRDRPLEANTVRSKAEPTDRVVRAGANPDSVYSLKMKWTVEIADREGAWSWGVQREWGETAWDNTIHPALQSLTQNTWGEICRMTSGDHKAHHYMEVTQLVKESQDRLIELERDYEIMFRFKLGNLPRLWGHRYVDVFHIVWYDPNHKIYPVD